MELMRPVLLFALAALLPQALVLVFSRAYAEQFGGRDDAFYLQLLEDLDGEPDHNFLDRIRENPPNMYFLFTRQNRNQGQILKHNDATSITSSNFNPNSITVFVVHGWLSNSKSNSNPTITKALLDHSDVNVIVVDWSPVSMLDYLTATRGVPLVGRSLGQFLTFLRDTTGIPYNSVHLVGFSLGSHIVGNAGRQHNGQVARITALDPAGPLWYESKDKLRKTDAVYVEAIHTNGGGLGLEQYVADADFFVNGGSLQPGCTNLLCNHNRSWQLFASSINNNHLIGKECSSTLQLFTNLCRGRSFVMGNNDLNKFGTGVYRLNTRARYPY